MKQTYPMTEKGLENLRFELRRLRSEDLPKAKERIKRARSFCDFREDSEYEAALKHLTEIEERIFTIKHKIQYATLIEKTNNTIVEIGDTVSFTEDHSDAIETYTIVGDEETDPLAGKISYNSPVAKSLLGSKVNDEVVVTTPLGNATIKVIAIS